jgi:hypothetical protein
MNKQYKFLIALIFIFNINLIAQNEDAECWMDDCENELSLLAELFYERFEYFDGSELNSEESILYNFQKFIKEDSRSQKFIPSNTRGGTGFVSAYVQRDVGAGPGRYELCYGVCLGKDEWAAKLFNLLIEDKPDIFGRVVDGSFEHFENANKITGKYTTHPVGLGYFSFNFHELRTEDKDNELRLICENVFDDKYIELGKKINNIFPDVDPCEPDEVYSELEYILLDMRQSVDFGVGETLAMYDLTYKKIQFIETLLPGLYYPFISSENLANKFSSRSCRGCIDRYIHSSSFYFFKEITRLSLGDEWKNIPLKTKSEMIYDVAFILLYKDITSLESITERVKKNRFSVSVLEELIDLSKYSSSFGDKEKKITTFYNDLIPDNGIDKILNPRNYLTQIEKDTEKYDGESFSYYYAEACYANREGYEYVYVTNNEINKIRTIFRNYKNSITSLDEQQKNEIDKANESMANTALSYYPNWNDNAKSLCSSNKVQFFSDSPVGLNSFITDSLD